MEVSSKDPSYTANSTHTEVLSRVCAFGGQAYEGLELCEASELAGHCLAAFRLKTDKESTEIVKIKTELEFHFVLLCDHLEILSVLKM